ncbi:polysaccharide biosynthesis protein [Flavobacterium sp.]|uniref:polysaccharide biosynthesis protein n=1 Tax=Flavobacterium sp. TaxID=239 RepID=UPI0038D21015
MFNKIKFFSASIADKYTEINLPASLKKLNYLPNWVILVIDFGIVLFSALITIVSFKGINLYYILPQHVFTGLLYYLSVNFFFFWYFKTYSGIIRHSSFVDALYLFYSQFLTFSVLMITDYILILLGHQKLVLTTASLFNALLSLILLFLFRITVKQIFQQFYSIDNKQNLIKAVIYGIDANSIAVANALLIENPRRFSIIGFVDVKNENTTKRILNLPILKYQRSLAVTMRIIKAEAIIIADSSLDNPIFNKIIQKSIDYNFKFFRAPILNSNDNKSNISKAIKKFEITDLLGRKQIELDTTAIASSISNKVVMVTGAAGSIGSEITRQLIRFKPSKIILLDQAETQLHELNIELQENYNDAPAIYILADVRKKDELKSVFEEYQPNIVFHAAAYKHVPLMEINPSQAVQTNILGTKNIADLALEYKVERFVMISTDKAVNPSSVMGASKRIAELYVQSLESNLDSTTKFITTRFGNVLGSNGSVVPLFTKQINQGGPVTITHPEIIRYFMTIPESCQLVLEACAMGSGGEIYIFDMGEPIKIIDLAKKMIRLAGYIPEIDIEIKSIGLRPGEKLFEELLNDTSKTQQTHHEKIMISKESIIDNAAVIELVNKIIEGATIQSSEEIVIQMKKIVPEYKSLNSVYQKLD